VLHPPRSLLDFQATPSLLFESFPPFPLASSSKLTPIFPFTAFHTGRCSCGRHSSPLVAHTLTDPNPSPATLGQLIYRFSVLCHLVAVVPHTRSHSFASACLALLAPRPASSSSMGQAPVMPSDNAMLPHCDWRVPPAIGKQNALYCAHPNHDGNPASFLAA
jgi:hypothetical protein